MTYPKTPTIAIVDDNELHRKTLRFVLQKFGYRLAFEAVDGRECILKMIATEPTPDIVILDIEMPDMDGFETAKRLKAHWPQTKILGHSSMDSPEIIKKMIFAGADLFLAKGNDFKEMQSALRQLLVLKDMGMP